MAQARTTKSAQLLCYLFYNNTLYALGPGGAGMLLGGLLTLRVDDTDDIRLPNNMSPADNLAYDALLGDVNPAA